MPLRRGAVLLLVLAGCRTPVVGGPSARPPSPFRIIAYGECPEQYPPAPAWALSPDAPKPSAVDLTGAWTPVDANAASGPVVRGPVCYEGLRFVTLIQKDGVVEAVWVLREPARGARVERWARQAEAEVGRVTGASLHLEGALLNERGHVESEKTERTCRPVVIDLTYDGASGHLVGTRDGSPLRLAPLVFKPVESQTNPCGAPPP
ncbi:MAG: hypothetical protein AB1938_19880 [Myxococcota bacterium]